MHEIIRSVATSQPNVFMLIVRRYVVQLQPTNPKRHIDQNTNRLGLDMRSISNRTRGFFLACMNAQKHEPDLVTSMVNEVFAS